MTALVSRRRVLKGGLIAGALILLGAKPPKPTKHPAFDRAAFAAGAFA